jgi:hypothetical protein
VTPDQEVADLPRRVAHVTHALIARWRDAGEAVTTLEVCEYDPEALTVGATRSALIRARTARLADGIDGIWFPTNAAMKLRAPLEARVLAEQDDEP